MGIVEKINALNVDKENDIPVEKAVLALLNRGIVGKKRISRVANVTDQDLAVFAGLNKMPNSRFLHDFLDTVKTSDAEQFNIRCSRKFKEMGLKYVTLLKLYQNRVEEMKSIPAGQFREMADKGYGRDRETGRFFHNSRHVGHYARFSIIQEVTTASSR